MSVKTIYTCDRCAAEATTCSQQWIIGVVCAPFNSSINNEKVHTAEARMHICRSCLSELGFIPQDRNKPPLPLPRPTLEDLIREIVEETKEPF